MPLTTNIKTKKCKTASVAFIQHADGDAIGMRHLPFPARPGHWSNN